MTTLVVAAACLPQSLSSFDNGILSQRGTSPLPNLTPPASCLGIGGDNHQQYFRPKPVERDLRTSENYVAALEPRMDQPWTDPHVKNFVTVCGDLFNGWQSDPIHFTTEDVVKLEWTFGHGLLGFHGETISLMQMNSEGPDIMVREVEVLHTQSMAIWPDPTKLYYILLKAIPRYGMKWWIVANAFP
ncbi:hypothetical protein MMC13_000463 [Lambiella insularis]|nr:hypothetical protein [Lambiella insularis]